MVSGSELRGHLRGRDWGRVQEILYKDSATPMKSERLMVAQAASSVSSRTNLVLRSAIVVNCFRHMQASLYRRRIWAQWGFEADRGMR